MNLTDRSFYLLNYFGIKCTQEEWIGIKLTDGLYDENNREYFIKFNNDDALKTSLPYIMHTADLFAARFENERWMTQLNPVKSTRNPNGRPASKGKLTEAFTTTETKFDTGGVFDAFKDIVED